ncbi:hypothetical protein [Rhizobium leguminosarum]|uniref:hypothetical protein n=1 Tax=Rhizobium leguminosarum TaxID=384 RepID=UPI00103220ED|nr:hypothetical protein [Rhizobium leguminosarum]TAV89302.1 hypothetical protein ELI22_08795 [Rhizobium leguminosarum]TAV93883.1 hypothetical protein ELI21_08785 [Rhizobium leguminosarum]TAW34960.1 hypothetical protein ELI23_08825 [Rhizobium leguminosarum]
MKYYVGFQQMGQHGRPIDHPSQSDFETDENGFGMIPNVGDYIQLIPMGDEFPAYSGRVISRLFRYFGKDGCGINIVVEDNPGDDWGKVIKE